MKRLSLSSWVKPYSILVCSASLLTLGGCQSSEEKERMARLNDSQTCMEFGTQMGTSEYADCMLKQQERRDDAALKAAEMQRAMSETTRNNMETVRRLGCEREAEKERERGEKPRDCR